MLIFGFLHVFLLTEGSSLYHPTAGNVLELHVISRMAEHPRCAICSYCEH